MATDRIAASLDPARILESISDAFFADDREWRFKYLNAKAEQIFRVKARRLIGLADQPVLQKLIGLR